MYHFILIKNSTIAIVNILLLDLILNFFIRVHLFMNSFLLFIHPKISLIFFILDLFQIKSKTNYHEKYDLYS